MAQSKGLPSFYTSVYKLVENPETDSTISWSKSNKSFIIWRPEDFKVSFLRCCGFVCSDFKNLLGDLKRYGFDRIKDDSGRLEFGNANFVRGQPDLMKVMHVKARKRRLAAMPIHKAKLATAIRLQSLTL